MLGILAHEFGSEGQAALVPQVLADDAIRKTVKSFFRTLPIALERPGVRVIHAYWDEAMIRVAREFASAEALYLE